MSADPRKLAAWIAASGAASVQLLFLAHKGDDGTETTCLASWSEPYDAAKLVGEALEVAQSDADAQRTRCQYALVTKGKETVVRRFAMAARPDAELAAGPTEPPNAHGVLGMLMRHQEVTVRSNTVGKAEVSDAWRELFGVVLNLQTDFKDSIKEMRLERKADEEKYLEARRQDQQFQLEMLKLAASNQRTEKLLETVVAPLMPTIAGQMAQALGGASVPMVPGAPGAPVPPPSAPSPTPEPPQPSGTAAPAPASPQAFREFCQLIMTNGVDPDELAAAVAAKVPEDQREKAQALLLETVKQTLLNP